MTKIVDCFTFYNELEMLKYRLAVLNNVVDYFIIVESTHTFVGKEKQLYFEENKNMFSEFMGKIIHVVVNDFPHKYPNVDATKGEVWSNEKFQRNAISRGINQISEMLSPTDLIIITDLDEIPNPKTLEGLKSTPNNETIGTLVMDLYYYNLNTKIIDKWYLPKIISYASYKRFKKCDDIRHTRTPTTIANGGWHLSYFGNKNFIQNKIVNKNEKCKYCQGQLVSF